MIISNKINDEDHVPKYHLLHLSSIKLSAISASRTILSLTPSLTHSSKDKFFFSIFSLLAGDVDLCLVPEVAIELEGERGCLPFLKQRVAEQGTTHIV